MNRLSAEKRAVILRALVVGNTNRAALAITGAPKNTVLKLLVDVGQAAGLADRRWSVDETQDLILSN